MMDDRNVLHSTLSWAVRISVTLMACVVFMQTSEAKAEAPDVVVVKAAMLHVGNGETIAIAGLLSEQVRGFASRIPGIGNVPVLGALFRSVNFRRSLSELVILVTPEIIAPLDTHQVAALKAKQHNDPNDFELYALGLLEGTDDLDGRHAAANGRGGASLARARAVSEPNNLSVHGQWGRAAPAGR